MATGPDHYREAERVLDYAEARALEYGSEWYANAMAAAQVHATLALAAATALTPAQGPYAAETNAAADWRHVITTPVRPDCTDTSDCPATSHDTDCPGRPRP